MRENIDSLKAIHTGLDQLFIIFHSIRPHSITGFKLVLELVEAIHVCVGTMPVEQLHPEQLEELGNKIKIARELMSVWTKNNNFY